MPVVNIRNILRAAQEQRASDVHLIANAPLQVRLGDNLVPLSKESLTPEHVRELTYQLLTPEQIATFEKNCDLDLMVTDGERSRYRINVSYNDGNVGSVIRLLNVTPRPLESLRMPPSVDKLCEHTKGFILITGSTSAGKTTTMAAMIDRINAEKQRHVITIEDPIEYVHLNKQGIVRQREIGRDTATFVTGLRAALRQDPDVIAIGEMRDLETIEIALTAAETGVLVISTLHTISLDKIIERLLSYAPPEAEGHIRCLLADTLQGCIHQELLPTRDGGKRVAVEILMTNTAVRNVIRTRGLYQLRNLIAMGSRLGMRHMKASLDELLEENTITKDVYDATLANYQ